MEPESSSPTIPPEHRVPMDHGSVERFMTQVREHALGVLDFKRQWEEYEDTMALMERSVLEVQNREEESDMKRSLEAHVMILVLEMQTKEAVDQLKESMKRKDEELQVTKEELEARQKELSLFDDTITEKSNELKKNEEEFQVKQDAQVRDIEVKSKSLEVKEKNFEELMRELEVGKLELEARQKELSFHDETIKEKSTELEKKEEQFQLKQDAKTKDVEAKRKSLELKEKKVEELMSEFDVRKQELDVRQKELRLYDETIKEKSTELEKKNEQFQLKQDSEAREIEVKRKSLELKEKELEEREELLERKEKELDEQSKRAENRKRSRDELEISMFAENDIDYDCLIHHGKKHKHDDKEKETNSNCELYGSSSSDSASASQAKGREIYEVVCIDDEADEDDPEPYNCLDADFNNFNNTISSFSVGQVWALYDPSDHMPRYYAQIRRIFKRQLRVEVTWLEPKQTTGNKKPISIACGEFNYGEKTINSYLTFSHLMHHIRSGKNDITINPRRGEIWALFRDWKQQKRPYRYDFVQVVSELDSVEGIGVAYLGRVEGFTSVYELAEHNGVLQMMIRADEMLRFSHRVPCFKLTGGEKEGVPAGSFELDPAAIPRDYLEASDIKEEESIGHVLGLSLVQV